MPDFISSPGLFVREQKPRPVGGFRGALYKMTAAVNMGPSARQREEDELARRISRQLQGSYNTAVLSLKGGIGKTSTTVGVGLTLAEFRGDPPCAIDANPDSGDLVERALGEGIYQQPSPRTITDLLKNIDSVDSLTALARYMHHAGRLHLIAGEQDPEVSDSLTAEEYLRIRKLISSYYSVALTDCGTGVTHNAMSGHPAVGGQPGHRGRATPSAAPSGPAAPCTGWPATATRTWPGTRSWSSRTRTRSPPGWTRTPSRNTSPGSAAS